MTGTTERMVPVVTTPSGRVRGVRRDGHAAFLGIPYAEPPVGDLRFAPPVPRAPWEGVRDATAYGATPLRAEAPGLIPEPAIPGDDTLSVNVFTPDENSGSTHPVLVWIHGGGYTGGSPASPWYDGGRFTRDGIVVVTLSYRLGFEGFAAIPGAGANRAVRDWVCALEWVQTHIGSFGGDPTRVTLAGQSAGGGAVLTLLGIRASAHLFRAAWVSSPVLPVRSTAEAERATARLARRLGVAATEAGFASVPPDRIIAEQTAVGLADIVSLSRFIDSAPSFSPVVDGELLAEPTLDAMRRGAGSHASLVIGSNDHEFTLPDADVPHWSRFIPSGLALGATGLGARERREYRAAQREHGVDGAVGLVEQEISDRVFRRNVERVTRARAAAGAETRAYRFSWVSPTKGAAIHCLDVPFLWDVLDRPGIAPLAGEHPPQRLADTVHGALAAHVRGDALEWPIWSAESRRVAQLGGPSGPLTYLDNGYALLDALRERAS